jgi:hypothetical protein
MMEQDENQEPRVTPRGRKPLPENERKGRFQVFLTPATVAVLEAYAKPDEALGQTIDRFVQAHA